MTYVVAEPCFGKYTDCVVVCLECSVGATFHEDNLPEEWLPFTEFNAEMALKCEVITEKKEPLAKQ